MKIIAELSSSHEGDLNKALALVERAAWAGATHFKVQYFYPGVLYPTDERLRHRAALQVCPLEWFEPLRLRTEECGLQFGASTFCPDSFQAVEAYCDFLKLAGSTVRWPSFHILLDIISGGRETFVSVPGDAAVDDLLEWHARSVAGQSFYGLVVSTQYPTPIWDAGIERVRTLSREYPYAQWGYSDHTRSLQTAAIVYALGGRAIEKHLCLGDEETPDSAVSVTPEQFRRMVMRYHETVSLLELSHPLEGELERILQDTEGAR